ncbi:MAG: PEP-CTERM sorting domain-containing protein, partial [Planctomycetota bacterium]
MPQPATYHLSLLALGSVGSASGRARVSLCVFILGVRMLEDLGADVLV